MVVGGDERMVEPGLKYARRFDLQVVAPFPALGDESILVLRHLVTISRGNQSREQA